MADIIKDTELNQEDFNLEEMPFDFDDFSTCSENKSDYIEENIYKLNTFNLDDILLDADKFRNGVNDVSYLCGAISALVSVGITPNKAMDYITDKEATDVAMRHNLEMLNIQKETSVETARLSLSSNADSILKF